jgi:NADPH2:quinone reductase
MDSYDGTEKLRLSGTPDPTPGPGEVFLALRFAALNPADAFLAKAMYPAKPALPHILGRDGVGHVAATGSDANNLRLGDLVGILR